jgi:Tol biopolymer transport system component
MRREDHTRITVYPEAMEPNTGARARRPRAAAAVAVILAMVRAAAALPVVRHLRERPPAPPPATRLGFPAPAGTELGAGDETLDAAISPDGRDIVFVATANGTASLWKRSLNDRRADPLPGTEGARLPAWKPTGHVIAFFAGSRLKQISLADGGVRDLGEFPDAMGASWRPDGALLLGSGRGPIRKLQGGVLTDVTRLSPGDRYHAYPSALPASAQFVYVAVRDDGRRIIRLAGDAGGDQQTHDLAQTSGHGQVAGEHLLYVRDGVLLAQRFDVRAGIVSGRSVAIASDVGVSAAGRGYFTSSARLLLTAPAAFRARTLAWYDLNGTRSGSIGDPGDYWQVRLSPDDSDAAVTTLDPLLRTLDVIIIPTSARGAPEPLSLALSADSDPVWSEDGTRVLFRSLQDGVPNLFTRLVHQRTAPDEPLLRSELDETATDWRDSVVLFQAPGKGTGLNVWEFDPATREVTGVATSGFNESDARWSPDGRSIAYVSDESGRPDVYVAPLPEGPRIRVSFAGGSRPRWSRDGRALFFVREDELMRADVTGEGFATPVPVAMTEGVRDVAVAHRSDRILALIPVQRGTAVEAAAVVDWLSTLTTAGESRTAPAKP